MLNTIGKEGLVICKDLSGNSGSFRWSSNAMDVVGFGHIDAYVNAWTYRALRNADVMLGKLKETSLAEKCREGAESILGAYSDFLVTPDTHWVAGWRSRDGKLHDYAFLLVNGIACAFGLLSKKEARKALTGLEHLRDRVGPGTAYSGIPINLLPIHRDDHMLWKMNSRPEPTFENYTDGSLIPVAAAYYLRALSICGLKSRAKKIADELEIGYRDGMFFGGFDTGVEFHTWDGLNSGYEGTFGPSFSALYGIAIEQGIITPPEPEWWPAEI